MNSVPFTMAMSCFTNTLAETKVALRESIPEPEFESGDWAFTEKREIKNTSVINFLMLLDFVSQIYEKSRISKITIYR
jgi:hypothetical protein